MSRKAARSSYSRLGLVRPRRDGDGARVTAWKALPGRCPETGKLRLPTRTDAEAYRRTRFPGERMHAYDDCPHCPGFWHIGHPRWVGRRPGEICGVDPAPAFRREGAARAAHILAGAGFVVTRCGWHWHLVPVPALTAA
ncbi:hypothetical protein ABT352_33275 [Streptosporangium sp. NPDC000563]|uniref:hypothetical protein n=1 Tax=Streptosporangium sp. NPDC000563 TaxID=3154366 RepID=UPI00332E8BCF